MQLAGPWVMGPPGESMRALWPYSARRSSRDHPHRHQRRLRARVTDELIREALHPYPEALFIATKVGATRDAQRWLARRPAPEDLRKQVHEDLRSPRGRDARPGEHADGQRRRPPARIRWPSAFGTLVELQREGLIRHSGVSNVTAAQVAEAQAIAPIVCVQNKYNLATATTTSSSTGSRPRTSPTCRSSRWAASPRCSPRPLDGGGAVRRHADVTSRSPGCCSDRRTSC